MAIPHNKKTIVTFFGAPGCGKGSLSQLIVKNIENIQHISLGNICRKYANQKTLLGEKIKHLIDNGNLVTLEIIEDIVKNVIQDFYIEDRYDILLFDGYPRNYDQFQSFFSFFEVYFKKNMDYYIVIFQSCRDILKQRLLNRYVCPNNMCEKIYAFCEHTLVRHCENCQEILSRRVDDTYQIINKRLSLYFNDEELVLDYIKSKVNDCLFLNGDVALSTSYHSVCDFFEKNNILIKKRLG